VRRKGARDGELFGASFVIGSAVLLKFVEEMLFVIIDTFTLIELFEKLVEVFARMFRLLDTVKEDVVEEEGEEVSKEAVGEEAVEEMGEVEGKDVDEEEESTVGETTGIKVGAFEEMDVGVAVGILVKVFEGTEEGVVEAIVSEQRGISEFVLNRGYPALDH